MSNTYKSVNIQSTGGGGSGNPPYVLGFIVGTWVLSGSDYTITVTEATHGLGTQLIAEVYELAAGVYEAVDTEISITSAGNVTIKVTGDLRFPGKLVIIGE